MFLGLKVETTKLEENETSRMPFENLLKAKKTKPELRFVLFIRGITDASDKLHDLLHKCIRVTLLLMMFIHLN